MQKILLYSFLYSLSLSIFLHAEPPRSIPKELYDEYTLWGKIPVLSWYHDDSYSPDTPLEYTTRQIEENLQLIGKRQESVYGATDSWLYQALDKYRSHIQAKNVAVIGSIRPWYESVVLYYGGLPTTIEYNKIVTKDPRLELLTVTEYEQNPRQFDAIFSISSIEHDGLGRYGDPLNPAGDFAAMNKMKAMLKDNGLLFLAVPIGKDCLCWNVHRIYGRLRFPLLISGWQIVDSFGFSEGELDTPRGGDGGYQPILVLRPIKSS